MNDKQKVEFKKKVADNKRDGKKIQADAGRYLFDLIEALRPDKTQGEIAVEIGINQSKISELATGPGATWSDIAGVARIKPLVEILIGMAKHVAAERLKALEAAPSAAPVEASEARTFGLRGKSSKKIAADLAHPEQKKEVSPAKSRRQGR